MRSDAIAARLLGAWQLVSWQVVGIDGSGNTLFTREPFGASPDGLILYSEDGWMSATVHEAARARFSTAQSPRALDDSTVAAAYRSYFHYAGRWRVQDTAVIHEVQHALNPNMVGTEQRREVSFGDGQLQLTGIESLNDQVRTHTLLWAR